MPIFEYSVQWSGARIGSGASVMHAGTDEPSTILAQAFAAKVNTFFGAIAKYLPNVITIQFPNEVKVFEGNGTLIGVETITAPPQVNATGTAPFINGAGGCVRWNTGAVAGGRRIVGRTFIVPMVSDAFQTGNTKATTQGDFNTAINGYLANSTGVDLRPAVWAKSQSLAYPITSGALLNRPSTLRTRNDR